ncbi:hypothetical protein PDE_03804 [Penicillium oxalicum 114-2]|uniref:HNH nuclease domain-containing protein n=1 Tax=Penicillium oxalicum (strain 114-2 / CGMCC 5302) TaxID=933388 RepID=S8AS60_PENO1|nr:hypothetical protein PDE_03804 [Penicillium oxalicum 114-2]
MAPPKRRASSLAPPLRRSRRLQETPQPPPQQLGRGLSIMSTDTETPEKWKTLAGAAKVRTARYRPEKRPHENLLQPSLDAFVDWLPEGGRESVARDINDAKIDEELHDVFMNLFTGLAIPMKAHSRTSSVTESPCLKRLRQVEIVASCLDEPQPRDHQFKDLCLQRDNYRCIATGQMDTGHWDKTGRPDGVLHAPTNGAHESRKNAASAWRVLYTCFPGVRRAALSPDTINSESNGLTLVSSYHEQFGSFQLAFKPVEYSTDLDQKDQDNKYEVKTYTRFPPYLRPTLPQSGFIELKKSNDAQNLQLPNQYYLDCHWRLAEVLNASGMGEVIDRNLQRWEALKGTCHLLREDGSTDIDSLLRAALWAHVIG